MNQKKVNVKVKVNAEFIAYLNTLNHASLSEHDAAGIIQKMAACKVSPAQANTVFASCVDGNDLLAWAQFPRLLNLIVGWQDSLDKIFKDLGCANIAKKLLLALSDIQSGRVEQPPVVAFVKRLGAYLDIHKKTQQPETEQSAYVRKQLYGLIRELMIEPENMTLFLQRFPDQLDSVFAVANQNGDQPLKTLHRLVVNSNKENIVVLKEACVHSEAGYEVACQTVMKLRGNQHKSYYAQLFYELLSEQGAENPFIGRLEAPLVVKLLSLGHQPLKALLLQSAMVVEVLKASDYPFTHLESQLISGNKTVLPSDVQDYPLRALQNMPHVDRAASVMCAKKISSVDTGYQLSPQSALAKSKQKKLFLTGFSNGVALKKAVTKTGSDGSEPLSLFPDETAIDSFIERARVQSAAGDLAYSESFHNRTWGEEDELDQSLDSPLRSEGAVQTTPAKTPITRLKRSTSDPGTPPPLPERDDTPFKNTPPALPPHTPVSDNKTRPYISPRAMRFKQQGKRTTLTPEFLKVKSRLNTVFRDSPSKQEEQADLGSSNPHEKKQDGPNEQKMGF